MALSPTSPDLTRKRSSPSWGRTGSTTAGSPTTCRRRRRWCGC
uniref:Uncharacterized protein n=1 Tax=Arundo donax TaxID=35708 RepID=A0A0A9CRT6_ARUDO